MNTLYYSPGACSLAAHIVLEWIGEPYKAVKVDLHHLPDGYLLVNPAGAVPALDHGGPVALTQASAVLGYLARTNAGADLLDDDTPERAAELAKWMAFLTGDLHPAFWPYFTPGRYTTSSDPAALADVRNAGLELVKGKLALLERQLADAEWFVFGKRTIVDAYATPMLNWATAILPDGLADYPSLAAHRRRMRTDPAVLRVMAAEGLPIEIEEQHDEHA